MASHVIFVMHKCKQKCVTCPFRDYGHLFEVWMLTIYFTVVCTTTKVMLHCFSCVIVLSMGSFYFYGLGIKELHYQWYPLVCLWKKRLRYYGDSMSLYPLGTLCPLHGTRCKETSQVSRENITLDFVSQRDYLSGWNRSFESMVNIVFKESSIVILCLCTLCSAYCTRMRDNLYSNPSLGSSRLCCGNTSLYIYESPLMHHVL